MPDQSDHRRTGYRRRAGMALVMFLAFISVMSPGGTGQDGNAMASEPLTFSMTDDMAAHWRFVTDGVMGGVSRGGLRFGQDADGTGFAHMTGTVSTANNGGFIQFRAGVDFSRIVTTGISLTGIRIRARGNDQTYYIHLRTRDTRRPWHYYSAAFTVNGTWQQHTLPFSGFTHSAGHTPPTPAVDQLTSIGIVAYGRDHTADIAVSDISFY